MRQIKRAALWWAMITATSAVCFADLDEESFEHYSEGELLGQNDWLPQALNAEGTYVATSGRGEIRREAGKKGQSLVWRFGFGDREQTRLIKRFPATTGTKVDIKFDFTPGSSDVGGLLRFDQENMGGVGLRFIKHTLHVTNFGDNIPVDTRQKFEENEPNHVELQLDFETHKVEVFLNGNSVGVFSLPPELTRLAQLVFFGGGAKFESALSNLSIQSVTDFGSGSPQAPTK